MESSSKKKWLIGCGIGCGVVIILAALTGVGGYFFIRNIVDGFRDSEAIMSTLTERFGRIKDYSPEPDGTIKPERIGAFLEARETMKPDQEKLEESLKILSNPKKESEIESKPSGNVFTKIKIGLGLIPQIANFFKSRNQALLDAGMGMGEYYYIYSITYFSWLNHADVDGPPIQLTGDDDEFTFGDWDGEESLEVRRDMILRRLNRMILPMLRNQQKILLENKITGIPEDWPKILSDEIATLESNRYRLMWQEGLPEIISSSLEPFRKRLQASYSPMMNALEIAIEQH